MSAKPETSLRYLKRIDSKMNKLLALATKYVEGAAPAAAAPAAAAATEPEELPFYFQSNAAAAAANAPAAVAAAANASNANANAPAAAAAAASTSKLNNWNRHVAEVLQEMREAKWKNPTTGKNATRSNAMKEASRRKAETNSNYAARTRSRREKRNRQLAKKGLSAVPEEASSATSNLPAATSGNLVAAAAAANLPTAVNRPTAVNLPTATAAAATAAAASAAAAGANVAPGPVGPPRKGNGRPPPSFYQEFKAPSVPITRAPPPGQQESRLYHPWNPPTITNVYSTQAPAQRQARSLQRSIDAPYAHPSWQAHWKKKINNLKPAINAELAAGIKLEND